MRSIVLVQHCQSEHHVNGIAGGWTDTPLTTLVREQASCVAARLEREIGSEPIVLYCSDLKRSRQTAEIIGQVVRVEPQPVKALRVFNTGIAAWKTKEWADANAAPRVSEGRGLDRQPFPEAETERTFYERVAECMEDLYACQLSRMVVVSHGGTSNAIISWWLRLGVQRYDLVDFRVSPGGITVLGETSLRQRSLERLNDLSRLQQAGLAPVPSMAG